MLAKRAIAYVNHNIKIHVRYEKWDDVSAHGLGLDGYADADFADKASPERKSTLGYVFFLSGAVFSWRSKRQETTATSTTESEYIALYHASANPLWVHHLLEQIGLPLSKAIWINCDNDAARMIASGEATHAKVKHIDTKYHRMRQWIERNLIYLNRCDSDENCANGFTKPLPREGHLDMMNNLGLSQIPASPLPDEVALQFIDEEDKDDLVYVDADDEGN